MARDNSIKDFVSIIKEPAVHLLIVMYINKEVGVKVFLFAERIFDN